MAQLYIKFKFQSRDVSNRVATIPACPLFISDRSVTVQVHDCMRCPYFFMFYPSNKGVGYDSIECKHGDRDWEHFIEERRAETTPSGIISIRSLQRIGETAAQERGKVINSAT